MEEKTNEEKLALEKERQELIEKIANLEQDKANTVGELQSVRKERAELKEKLELLNKEEEGDVEKTVKEVLSVREKENAKKAFQNSVDSFKSKHSEFENSNDAGGIKFKLFERELSKFNLEGLTSENEFNKRLEEVYEFMNRGKKDNAPTNNNPYAATPNSGGAAPRVDDLPNLSSKEKSLLKSNGWSLERYLKVKEKRPDYIRTILQYQPE